MSDLSKTVTLLGLTDGRDKIYKSLLGIFRVLAAVAESRNDPHTKSYESIVLTIRNARSLMRMGKFFSDFTKLKALLDLFKAQGITHTENKKFVEFIRVLCNALYVVTDNIAFLCRFRVFDIHERIDVRACTIISKRSQLLGYILSLIFNLYELRDGLRRLEYDPPAAKKASTKAAVSATRDVVDVLVTAAVVGGAQPLWNPSDVTVGSLTFVSGCLSTYLNWKKIK